MKLLIMFTMCKLFKYFPTITAKVNFSFSLLSNFQNSVPEV